MFKTRSFFITSLLVLFSSVDHSLALENSGFSSPPNVLEQMPQPSIKSISFGTNVLGVLIPKGISDRCDCLLVWNGTSWNEDMHYAAFGANVLESDGFYRPYNHSHEAYAVRVQLTEWSELKASNQFYKSFNSAELNSVSVIQLDSPHAPFVYLEMSLGGKLEVLRLETPQDLTPNIESWLKQANYSADGKTIQLSLTYDLYQTGTGREPDTFTVHYRFKEGTWHAIHSE
jgi:hypothetical protein